MEKIEELFTKLDAGVRSLEQTQTLLKSYRRSVLRAAVEGGTQPRVAGGSQG